MFLQSIYALNPNEGDEVPTLTCWTGIALIQKIPWGWNSGD